MKRDGTSSVGTIERESDIMTERLERFDQSNGTKGAGGLPPLPSLEIRSRTRSQVLRLRILAFLVGVAWLGALLVETGLRPDRHELSPLYAYGLPAVMYVSGMLLLGMAVSRGRSGAGPRPRWVRLCVVVLPLLFMLTTLWIEFGAHSMMGESEAMWAVHLACGAMTMVLGAVPFAVAVLALRYAFPVHAAGRGALVGLCCGLAGAATIHLHCPVATTPHILLSHGGPLLVLTVLGAVVGRRFLRT